MPRWVFTSAPQTAERRSTVEILAAALPGAVLAAVALADWWTPATTYRFLVPLLTAVPALAGATWGIRGTIVFILLSFANHVVLSFVSGRMFSDPQSFYGGILGLTAISVASLLPGHLHGRREKTVQRLRSVAEAVQRAVLAPVPDRVDGLRASAGYRAAHEEARIGGDLYEVLDTPYGVRMIVGDATGKGMNAVEAAANLLGAFREAARYAPDLPTLAQRLEDSVRHLNIRHHGNPHEAFVTALLLSVPPEGPVAEMLCCGHPGPLLLRAGEITDVQANQPALPLGLGDLGTRGYPVEKFSFDVGERLLLYTDGVIEARDITGDFYPLIQRAATWTDNPPEELIRNLAHDLMTFTGGKLHDDAVLLACERLAPTDRPINPGSGEHAA